MYGQVARGQPYDAKSLIWSLAKASVLLDASFRRKPIFTVQRNPCASSGHDVHASATTAPPPHALAAAARPDARSTRTQYTAPRRGLA